MPWYVHLQLCLYSLQGVWGVQDACGHCYLSVCYTGVFHLYSTDAFIYHVFVCECFYVISTIKSPPGNSCLPAGDILCVHYCSSHVAAVIPTTGLGTNGEHIH
ncbi:hypothetical protein FKM82_021778 [Ascaphus truei]